MFEREWRFYLNDMLHFAENVLAYCEGLDRQSFETTGLNHDATVRNLELIGGAATHFCGSQGSQSGSALAANHRNAQQTDTRLFGNR